MSGYELCLGDVSLDEIVERIAVASHALVPLLSVEGAREAACLMLRSRAAQTEACGLYAECQPDAPVWGGWAPPPGRGRPCRLRGADAEDLPRMYAASLSDTLALAASSRADVEDTLAAVFHAALSAHLFHNDRCGHAAVCRASPALGDGAGPKTGRRQVTGDSRMMEATVSVWVLGFDYEAVVGEWQDARLAGAIEKVWCEAGRPADAQAWWMASGDQYAFRWYLNDAATRLLDDAKILWRPFVIGTVEEAPPDARPFMKAEGPLGG